ncbi:MAG: HDOD domain-containing protein, partial [Verrucomicrobiota bacterium]
PPRLAAPAPALTATVLRTAVSRPSASRPTVPPAIAAPSPAPDPGLVQRCGERLAKIDVPAPSPVQAAVLDLAQSPAFSFPAAIALVRRDPRLATAVERMANLEPYGGRVAAAGLTQAISRVGAAGLVVAVVEQLARPVAEPSVGRAGALLRSPWRHALASAFLARRLAPVVRDPGEPAHAYLVALLAGIGRPLVARAIDELERLPDPLRSGQRRLWPEPAMLEAIAAHRDAMAERLARGWCLPTPVVDGLAGPRAAVASSRQARLCRLAGGLADLEGQFVRREDADRAPEIVAIEQVRLGVDEATLVEARRRLRSWLAARL